MYTKEELLNKLKSKELREIYKKHNFSRVYLFGSYSKEQQKKDSDVDLLIEYSPKINKEILYKKIFGDYNSIKSELESVLKNKVDFVPKILLKEKIINSIDSNSLIKII